MHLTLIRCLIVSILCVTISFADTDNDDTENNANGLASVKLDKDAQELAGISVSALEPARFQAEFLAYGKAISIQPLLDLHHRYLATLAEREQANAKFKQAEQAFNRQQDLYKQGISAKRHLQEQQAQWQTDKALLNATQFQDQAILDEALLNWGNPLASWALSLHAEKLTSFLTGQQTLLQITLPSHHSAPENLRTIAVEVSGDRSKAQAAELIAIAPQTDGVSQGISYFFRTSGKTIKTGMSVSAWLPGQSQQQEGIIIPKSAVCWSMDQAYVYQKNTDNTFTRRPISPYNSSQNGYFVNHSFKPGDLIVTTGAQMLLSQEMRGSIADDDD
jgi:hypothetical protein